MTVAVCYKCGELKHGAFKNCTSCGVRPVDEVDMARSLAFTDHYYSLDDLKKIGEDVAGGVEIQFDPHTMKMLLESVNNIQPIISGKPKKKLIDFLRRK